MIAGAALFSAAFGAGCSSSDAAGSNDGGPSGDGAASDDAALSGDQGTTGTTGDGASPKGDAGTSDGSASASRLAVNLGTAGDYAILAKSGISTVPTSAITGDLGVSPAAATYITGFSLTADATNVFSTSPQVTGKVYAADYAPPTPSNLTTAVGDMQLAFTDAAGRAPDVTELGAGNIGGMTLARGRLQVGHRPAHPDGRHPHRERDRRLDLPDRAGPHHEQRDEGRPDRRRGAEERLLAGRRHW